MKSYIAIGVLLGALFIMSSSHAGQGNDGVNCNGSGSCGQTTTNNSYTSNSPVAYGGNGGNGTGIGIGGAGGRGGDAEASAVGLGGDATSGAIAGSQSGAVSGSSAGSSSDSQNSINNNIGGDKVEAPNIPTASSIAVSGNGTAKCLIHKQVSFNAFFVSFANGGHEVEYTCMAEELGLHQVAIQMSCNKDSAFKKAYNQVAKLNGTDSCLE
jgi:hypothetical protein